MKDVQISDDHAQYLYDMLVARKRAIRESVNYNSAEMREEIATIDRIIKQLSIDDGVPTVT